MKSSKTLYYHTNTLYFSLSAHVHTHSPDWNCLPPWQLLPQLYTCSRCDASSSLPHLWTYGKNGLYRISEINNCVLHIGQDIIVVSLSKSNCMTTLFLCLYDCMADKDTWSYWSLLSETRANIHKSTFHCVHADWCKCRLLRTLWSGTHKHNSTHNITRSTSLNSKCKLVWNNDSYCAVGPASRSIVPLYWVAIVCC